MLVTQQVIGQIREAMVPFLFLRQRSQKLERTLEKRKVVEQGADGADIDAATKKQIVVESAMDVYEVSLNTTT
jgi:hypothetical protein